MKVYPLNRTKYFAEGAQMFNATRTTGVFSADNNLAVTPLPGLQVQVSTGLGWMKITEFGGVVFGLLEPKVLDLEPADGALGRVDRIICRANLLVPDDSGVFVVKGALGTKPEGTAISILQSTEK